MSKKNNIDINKNKKNLVDKNFKSKTDPQGSYTGNFKNPYEEPVQDADDL